MPLKNGESESKIKAPTTKPVYGKGYAVTRIVEKTKKDYSGVFPNGKDDGRGAQRMLYSVVDEVLNRKRSDELPDIEEFPPITNKLEQSEFIQKLDNLQLNDVPLISQLAVQQAIWPTHTSEKRKRITDLRKRLLRNDGGLVRCRLNCEEIDDDMLKLLTDVLPKNIYLQHLILHDNAITDKGVEQLAIATRFHPSIHTIWLGGNQISDYGAAHLATLIGLNFNVKDLNLSNRWPRETWSRREEVMHPHVTVHGAESFATQLQQATTFSLFTGFVHELVANRLLYILRVLYLIDII